MNVTPIVIMAGVIATQLFFIQQVLIRIAEALERPLVLKAPNQTTKEGESKQ